MRRKDWIDFVNHVDDIEVVSSVGDITSKPPPNTGLEENLKVTHFLSDSFKKSIKRDGSLFTSLNDRKNLDMWLRITLATTRSHDVS